jgi:hypothetical protein
LRLRQDRDITNNRTTPEPQSSLDHKPTSGTLATDPDTAVSPPQPRVSPELQTRSSSTLQAGGLHSGHEAGHIALQNRTRKDLFDKLMSGSCVQCVALGRSVMFHPAFIYTTRSADIGSVTVRWVVTARPVINTTNSALRGQTGQRAGG